MKILIVSQYFWPESFRINDLVKELMNRGYDVHILTAKPNYPQGKFYKGYSFFSKHNEAYFGAKIFRVPIIPRGSSNSIMLVLNYLSFVFFSSLRILFKSEKYDFTLTFAISPITQILPALLHKKIKKSKSLLWLQDLWPESITAASNVKSKFIISSIGKMVRCIYKNTDYVLIQSENFRENLLKYNCNPSKIVYLPNWAEDIFIHSEPEHNKYEHLFPNGFKVVFAGNIGKSQDFESIVEAAKIISNRQDNIKFVVIGNGRQKDWLLEQIKGQHLENTIYCLGSFPVEEMPNFFVHANCMLVTLRSEPIFSLTIPAKLQSYMAFGKPIIGMLDGIGNKIISESNCGYSCNGGDYNRLSEIILKMYNEHPDKLNKFAQNAKTYYNINFSKENIIDRLEQIFVS